MWSRWLSKTIVPEFRVGGITVKDLKRNVKSHERFHSHCYTGVFKILFYVSKTKTVNGEDG